MVSNASSSDIVRRFIAEVKEIDGVPYLVFPEGEELPWEEGDHLEWIDNKDGTFTLRKKIMDFVEKVCLFNQIAGNKNEFDPRRVALYIGLQAEEFAEKIKAIGVRDTEKNKELYDLWLTLEHFASAFKKGEYDEEVAQIDRVEALDADIDLAVVALGGAYSIGADVNGACHEVADSNLSKYPVVNGEYVVYKDANGKIMKAETYQPPKLEGYLK